MFNHLTVLFWLESFKHFILRRCIYTRLVSLIHSTLIYLTFLRHSETRREIRFFNLFFFSFSPSTVSFSRISPSSTHILLVFSLLSSGDVNVDRSCNIHSAINLISRGTRHKLLTDSAKSTAHGFFFFFHIKSAYRITRKRNHQEFAVLRAPETTQTDKRHRMKINKR